MNNWEIAILILLFVGFILECLLHGEDMKGKHNALSKLLNVSLTFFLMYKAGLFQIFG